MLNKTETKSRKVFGKIHDNQSNNHNLFKRISTLFDTKYFQVNKDFFKDKVCLDAGCGSSLTGMHNLLSLGAKKVYGLDLNDTIFNGEKNIKKFKGKYELKTGSILSLPFPDNSFDFVMSVGVLHHTTNFFKGLKELKRVLKPNGTLYVEVEGKGGLVRELSEYLRKKYRCDKEFNKLIKGLNTNQFNILDKIMFDEDLVGTIKDRLQAPLYTQTSEKEIVDWLKKEGFTNIRRLRKFQKFRNIRKYLAPIYYNYKHPFSRILYGDGGCVNILCLKDYTSNNHPKY